jgi:hypothetical protein
MHYTLKDNLKKEFHYSNSFLLYKIDSQLNKKSIVAKSTDRSSVSEQ